MKIGLVSYKLDINSLNYNIKQIERAMKEASGKADLLIFGETFLQGFSALSDAYSLDKDIAITTHSIIFKELKDLTIKYGVDILLGYYELANEEDIYSSMALISKGDLLYNYRRITPNWHKEGANKHYKVGKVVEDINYKDKLLRIALCGDLWIEPELFKTDGLLVWPVYLNFDLDEWTSHYEEEYLAQASKVARECVMVNSLSDHPKSYGNAFYYKDGKIVSSIGYDKEDILYLDI